MAHGCGADMLIEPSKLVSGVDGPGERVRRESGLLRLGHNERVTSFAADVLAEMLSAITPEDIVAIPDLTSLYAKLSKHLCLPQGQLLISPGADACIDWTFHAYVEPGDSVSYVTPTYHRYEYLCQLYGAVPRTVQCGHDLNYDVEELIRTIDRATKLVVIVNPHSPTGRVVSVDAIQAVITRAEAAGALVIADEVYHPFGGVSCLSIPSRSSHLLVLRSFSKAFGAAGLRVGYAIAAGDVIQQLSKVRIRHEISAVSARIVEYLLDHPYLMQEYVEEVSRSRKFVVEALDGSGYVATSSQSSSMMISIPSGLDRTALDRELRIRGVEVCATLRPPFERYLRVTLGPREQMAVFVEALRSATDALCGG
jgi:histidinol-phosphate aminotransferase